jgi:hypothetical protein
MQKTKWQQMMDAPKGGLEYNPNQSFALHVYWIVRSPTAAREMIERGFKPCVEATKRDTPTTMAYIFRISHDQRLAEKLKSEIKTIGQHPHYQPAFKSIQMGIPRQGIETKLNLGGINIAPLSWNADEPIAGHEQELDFDPIVLECTEIYLDDRSFYEHSSSRDWMKFSPEILKACRSLKPTTYCVGSPTDDIWSTVLEPSLKAIRFDNQTKVEQDIQPGVFLCKSDKTNVDQVMFLDLDLTIKNDKVSSCRSLLSNVQQELQATYMVVIPLISEDNSESVNVRVMMTAFYESGLVSASFKRLASECESVSGRVTVNTELCQNANEFLIENGLSGSVSVQDKSNAERENTLAGYPLHPLTHQIVENDQFKYQI